MKTLNYFALAAVAILAISCSKERHSAAKVNVPESVLNSFKAEYPNAKDVEWSSEGSNFEVEFEDSKIEKSNIYDPAGKVVERETTIKSSDLPPAIHAYLNTNYAGYEIEESVKKEVAESSLFEVEIEKQDDEKELIFDSNGNFLNEEVEEDNDDEERDDD